VGQMIKNLFELNFSEPKEIRLKQIHAYLIKEFKQKQERLNKKELI
jgi:hypothetical protein